MDYIGQLNTIIDKLNDLIYQLQNARLMNDLIFLLLALFIVLFVVRGE